MSDDDRFFITPPPGLLPPIPEAAEQEPVNTGSQTRRIAASIAVPPFRAMPTPPRSGHATPPDPTAARTTWAIVLADGTERAVTADGVVVGRNPTPPAAWPRAAPVAIDDPERSVSKTHVVLAVVDDGALRVVDLRSTNGVTVTVDGEPSRVTRDGAILRGTAEVVLGQYPLTARRLGPEPV